MPSRAVSQKDHIWTCLRCSQGLQLDNGVFLCRACGQHYPIVGGVAVLVHNPIGYLRSEIASLDRARRAAMQRHSWIAKDGPNSGLTEASLKRHADVLDTEIARAEKFLTLLEPARAMLASAREEKQTSAARGSGWGFDALFPYLLRDWTNTQELIAAATIIGEAIEGALPDRAGTTIVFAGCGAAGLLDQIPFASERVIGFDLTFPVLAAARHLLDGKELNVPMPRAVNAAGSILLKQRRAEGPSRVQIAAMDAFETAFPGNSVDCVVTSFFLDLLPDPTKLAKEIHRILCPDGVWINYGPSGPLQSVWRFDETEGRAFFQTAGFHVVNCSAVRGTYLDLSRDCPSWSFQNHVCYLTVARKTAGAFVEKNSVMPMAAGLLDAVPEHHRGAVIVQRQRLDGEKSSRILLQYEPFPGRNATLEINRDAVRILELVDGKRTVREIARLAEKIEPAYAPSETARILASYLEGKVLKYRPG